MSLTSSSLSGIIDSILSSPSGAISVGSSILVIGRAITNAPDRLKAAYEIIEDMEKEILS